MKIFNLKWWCLFFASLFFVLCIPAVAMQVEDNPRLSKEMEVELYSKTAKERSGSVKVGEGEDFETVKYLTDPRDYYADTSQKNYNYQVIDKRGRSVDQTYWNYWWDSTNHGWKIRAVNTRYAVKQEDGTFGKFQYFMYSSSGELKTQIPAYIDGKPVVNLDECFADSILRVSRELPDTVVSMEASYLNCKQMTTMPSIPDLVLNMKTTFKGCLKLVELSPIPKSVRDVTETFKNSGITETPIFLGDVNSLTGTFDHCLKLKKVSKLPNCTSMKKTFFQCENLINETSPIMIPDSVKEMDYTFAECISLKYPVIFPPHLQSAQFCYYNCKNLLTLPLLPFQLENIDHAFVDCKKLTITEGMDYFFIPSNVKSANNLFTGSYGSSNRNIVDGRNDMFVLYENEDTFTNLYKNRYGSVPDKIENELDPWLGETTNEILTLAPYIETQTKVIDNKRVTSVYFRQRYQKEWEDVKVYYHNYPFDTIEYQIDGEPFKEWDGKVFDMKNSCKITVRSKRNILTYGGNKEYTSDIRSKEIIVNQPIAPKLSPEYIGKGNYKVMIRSMSGNQEAILKYKLNDETEWKTITDLGFVTIDSSDTIYAMEEWGAISDVVLYEAPKQITGLELLGENTYYIRESSFPFQIPHQVKVTPVEAGDKTYHLSLTKGEDIAFVKDNKLYAKGFGSIEVTASAKDGSNLFATKQINIIKEKIYVDEIVLTTDHPDNAIILNGSGTNNAMVITPKFYPEMVDLPECTWSVNDENIAAIDENGVLTPKLSGKVVVYATAMDDNKVKGSITISVNKLVRQILIQGDNQILEGESKNYWGKVMDEDATNKKLVWNMMNETGEAVIDQRGSITAIRPGQVTIQAVAEDGSGVVGEKQVTIYPKAENIQKSIKIQMDSFTNVRVGDELTGRAQVLPEEYKDQPVTWEIIEGKDIATINDLGILKAQKEGIIKIKASLTNDTKVFDIVKVTILEKDFSYLEIISNMDLTTGPDDTPVFYRNNKINPILHLRVISNIDMDENPILWRIESLGGKANITQTGEVTGVEGGNGKVKITAVCKDKEDEYILEMGALLEDIQIKLNTGKDYIEDNKDYEIIINPVPMDAMATQAWVSLNQGGMISYDSLPLVIKKEDIRYDGNGVEVVVQAHYLRKSKNFYKQIGNPGGYKEFGIDDESGNYNLTDDNLENGYKVTVESLHGQPLIPGELDGVSLNGRVSVDNMIESNQEGVLTIKWIEAEKTYKLFKGEKFPVKPDNPQIKIMFQEGRISSNNHSLRFMENFYYTSPSPFLSLILKDRAGVESNKINPTLFDEWNERLLSEEVYESQGYPSSGFGQNYLAMWFNGKENQHYVPYMIFFYREDGTIANNSEIEFEWVTAPTSIMGEGQYRIYGWTKGIYYVCIQDQYNNQIMAKVVVEDSVKKISLESPPIHDYKGSSTITPSFNFTVPKGAYMEYKSLDADITINKNSIELKNKLAYGEKRYKGTLYSSNGEFIAGGVGVVYVFVQMPMVEITFEDNSTSKSVKTGDSFGIKAKFFHYEENQKVESFDYSLDELTLEVDGNNILLVEGIKKKGDRFVVTEDFIDQGKTLNISADLENPYITCNSITISPDDSYKYPLKLEEPKTPILQGESIEIKVKKQKWLEVVYKLESLTGKGEIVDINETGVKIVGQKYGVIKLKAYYKYYPNIQKEVTIEVINPLKQIKITEANHKLTLNPGDTGNFIVETIPWDASDGDYTYSLVSSVTGSAIDANGIFTAGQTPGTVTVRATANNKEAIFADYVLIILPRQVPVGQVIVSPGQSSVYVGKNLKFNAQHQTENLSNDSSNIGADVIWSVESILGRGKASISEDGLLTAYESGTVMVRATSKEDPNQWGTGLVTIINPVAFIIVNPLDGNSYVEISSEEQTKQMEAIAFPYDTLEKEYTWSIVTGSAVNNNATINQDGLLNIGKEKGQIIVRAESNYNHQIYGECIIDVGIKMPSLKVETRTKEGHIANNLEEQQGLYLYINNELATSQFIEEGGYEIQFGNNTEVDFQDDWKPSINVSSGSAVAISNNSFSSSQIYLDSEGMLFTTGGGVFRITVTKSHLEYQLQEEVVVLADTPWTYHLFSIYPIDKKYSINTYKGNLKMGYTLYPKLQNNHYVRWNIIKGEGAATVDQNGELTALGTGDTTILVEGSVIDEKSQVLITNQCNIELYNQSKGDSGSTGDGNNNGGNNNGGNDNEGNNNESKNEGDMKKDKTWTDIDFEQTRIFDKIDSKTSANIDLLMEDIMKKNPHIYSRKLEFKQGLQREADLNDKNQNKKKIEPHIPRQAPATGDKSGGIYMAAIFFVTSIICMYRIIKS